MLQNSFKNRHLVAILMQDCRSSFSRDPVSPAPHPPIPHRPSRVSPQGMGGGHNVSGFLWLSKPYCRCWFVNESLDQHTAPATKELRTNKRNLRKELNLGPELQTEQHCDAGGSTLILTVDFRNLQKAGLVPPTSTLGGGGWFAAAAPRGLTYDL